MQTTRLFSLHKNSTAALNHPASLKTFDSFCFSSLLKAFSGKIFYSFQLKGGQLAGDTFFVGYCIFKEHDLHLVHSERRLTRMRDNLPYDSKILNASLFFVHKIFSTLARKFSTFAPHDNNHSIDIRHHYSTTASSADTS